jgi:hypothetical protein
MGSQPQPGQIEPFAGIATIATILAAGYLRLERQKPAKRQEIKHLEPQMISPERSLFPCYGSQNE